MDFCPNVKVSGGLPSEYEQDQLFSPPCSKLDSLDDLFSSNCTEGDMNLEWLSVFVEDCLSSSGNCLPPAAVLPPEISQNKTTSSSDSTVIPKAENSKPLQLVKSQRNTTSSVLHKCLIPGKARSKRNRGPLGNKARRISAQFTSWSHHLHTISSDPPLLQQAYWLADSELILPRKEKNRELKEEEMVLQKEEVNNVIVEKEEEKLGCLGDGNGKQQQQQQHHQPRRCTHCLSQRTPQWRAGPLGPKTLCNACGVRYKSGRLLPEYRPAKSPTFVSYKHSNSHKKVLEMRTMSPFSSNS